MTRTLSLKREMQRVDCVPVGNFITNGHEKRFIYKEDGHLWSFMMVLIKDKQQESDQCYIAMLERERERELNKLLIYLLLPLFRRDGNGNLYFYTLTDTAE